MNAGVDRLGNVRGLLDEAKSSLCIGDQWRAPQLGQSSLQVADHSSVNSRPHVPHQDSRV